MSVKPQLEFVFEATIDMGETLYVGPTPRRMRIIYPITGDLFEGPHNVVEVNSIEYLDVTSTTAILWVIWLRWSGVSD